jgi:beta-hydroxylase
MHEAMSAVMGGLMTANNARARAGDAVDANPRPLDGVAWNDHLEANFEAIRAEWDAFAAAGGRLPQIERVLGEHQGNEGTWRAGLLLSRGTPVLPLASRFPQTVAALGEIPGLLAALWSVLDPGTDLPAHEGPNAGVLRYHFGVVSNPDAALMVAGTTVPYREGRGILFDDTATHAAWNRGDAARVTIMCELLRPLPPPSAWANRGVQRLRALDDRFRGAPARAAEWDRALNPWGDAAAEARMDRRG